MGGLGSIPGLGSAPPLGTGMSEFGSASDLTLTVTPGHRSYMTRGGLGLGPDDSGVMSNEFGDQHRLGSALSDSAPLTMARGQGQGGGEPRVLNPADGMSDDDALIVSSAAGIPWPVASASEKLSRSSSRRETSYRSPLTRSAGR